MGDLGSIPGLGRCPGGGHGNPLQYFCLENPMDRRAWWAIVHGIRKSQTQLSNLAHRTTKGWFSQNSLVFSIATLSNISFVCMFIFYKKESAILERKYQCSLHLSLAANLIFKSFSNMAPSQMMGDAMRLQSEKGTRI